MHLQMGSHPSSYATGLLQQEPLVARLWHLDLYTSEAREHL